MDKILYIGNFLSKTRGTIGPSVALADRFRRRGHVVNTASSRSNKLLRFAEMCGKATLFAYNTIIIDVYSTSALLFAYVCTRIARLRKKRIILTLRGGGLVEAYQVKGRIIDAMFRRANVITTPSLFLQSYFSKLGFEIVHIPNTIDIEKFSYVQERPHNHSILWVRAFSQIYNPDMAVKVLEEVKKVYPEATLTMVGPDKGCKEKTLSVVRELGLSESVRMTGKISNENLPRYYHMHDVYLNTTSYESFGVAVLEAAACGTPIVSTKVGEIPLMWKNNENILMADSFSEKELADCVCQLFDNRVLYRTIQENGRRRAEDFSWSRVENQWKDVIGDK